MLYFHENMNLCFEIPDMTLNLNDVLGMMCSLMLP